MIPLIGAIFILILGLSVFVSITAIIQITIIEPKMKGISCLFILCHGWTCCGHSHSMVQSSSLGHWANSQHFSLNYKHNVLSSNTEVFKFVDDMSWHHMACDFKTERKEQELLTPNKLVSSNWINSIPQ